MSDIKFTNFKVGYTVWKANGYGINERCYIDIDNNYVGKETGTIYLKSEHYHSDPKVALVKPLDVMPHNETGMMHLAGNSFLVDRQVIFSNKLVLIEEAHNYGEDKIYRGYLLSGESEYFNERDLIML